jgi:hypothetical protein
LAALGLTPGSWCSFEQAGDWRAGVGFADDQRTHFGVFSTSTTLFSGDQLDRVPDAVLGGTRVNTGLTLFGGEPTDITADFCISSNAPFPHRTVVQVPPGAQSVFFSPGDSHYGDNLDPDADFGVWITVEAAPAWAGTADGLVLRTGVDAPAGTGPGTETKTAAAGAVVTIEATFPFGAWSNTIAFHGVLLEAATAVPSTFFGQSTLWIDPLSAASLPLIPNFGGVPSGVVATTATIPPGLAGLSLMTQAVAVHAFARNGLFTASEAHRIVFL